MKKTLLTLILLVGMVFGLFAQKLTYQAVIRDNSQQLVTNTAVKATVSITFSTGTPTTYEETVVGSTNLHGLLSIEFGGDTLNGRDWTNATIAVKVVNAATPSTVYVNDDARPVSAVPYALSVNGSSIQNYLNEHHYVDLDKLNDTLDAYSTTAAMDARHYLTSDSAVITTMQSDISKNAGSIDNLILHTAKNAIRDSVAGQIHDSIAANAHTHSNKDLLDTYDQTNANLTDAVAKRHAHDNAAVLAATQAPYTDADSAKLHDIAEGAEVNVQSDWKQTDDSKDDYIKNKPSITDTVNGILTTGKYVTETTLDARHYLRSDSAVITTMQGNITTNTTNIATNTDNIAALANRVNTFNTNVCDSVKDCDFSDNTSIKNMLQQLTARLDAQDTKIDAQNAKIDSLGHIVDSLSNLPLGNTPTATFTCGTDSIKDVDNNWYHTVKIGEQCWMKENLRTKTHQYGTVWTKTDVDSAIYGRYYDWQAAMQIEADNNSSYTAGDKHRGICPEGWHVPSNAEWDTLTYYVYNSANPDYKCAGCSSSGWEQSTPCIANALSAATGWQSPSECTAGHSSTTLNATGFSAVPAGYYATDNFSSFGYHAYFWIATQIGADRAWCRRLRSTGSIVDSGADSKALGFSVRCVRDAGVGGPAGGNEIAGTTPSAPATMSCEQVMECMGDTLGKLNDKIENLQNTVASQDSTINAQNDKIDSLSQVINSGSGGDTPATFSCGTSKVKDVDNNEYNTVKIGTQCWTKENLRTTKYADNTNIDGSKMFNSYNKADSVAKYGKLYTWDAATGGQSPTIPIVGPVVVAPGDQPTINPATEQVVQGICPEGWHVPNNEEWDILTTYVNSKEEYQCDGDSSIANALSAATGWTYTSNCCAGHNNPTLNATGFSAVPADENFSGMSGPGYNAYFWSADGVGGGCYRWLNKDNTQLRSNNTTIEHAYSVRCLRDEPVDDGDNASATGDLR